MARPWWTCRDASSASAFTRSISPRGSNEETHACDYLLGADIEMEPVPGYRAASWERGYGDFTLKPDLATLRRIPWVPRHRAGDLRRGGSPRP